MQNTTFAERYQIIDLLGKGGMGEVYRAHDIVLNIDVAVKVLPSSLAELGAARLQREAIALAKLNHPNIARVLDFSQTKDNSPYMVMEYLNGESLDQTIKRQKVLDLKSAISIFTQICRGLDFAHSTGVIHRDLKPSNIMVIDTDGKLQIKILDFGIAKVTTENQRLTSTGVLVGSPLYMSPEHAEGIADKPPSDIYSLGCLMFECLTGVPPLKGANALETMSFHRSLAPPLISDIVPELNYPKELIELVDQCLRKPPEYRWQTAKEVEERLNEISQFIETGKIKSKEPLPTLEAAPKPKISQTTLALTGVSLIILAVLGSGIYAIINLPHTERNTTPMTKVELQEKKAQIERESLFKEDDISYSPKGDGNIHIKPPTTIRDDDFKQISKGTAFFLTSSDATGRGFYDITKLPLSTISIDKGQIEDKYCDAFTRFPLLGCLKVDSPKLTDKGVELISKQTPLKSLNLISNNITDLGISYLTKLKNLESLSIGSVAISPKSLIYLVPLNQLQSLRLAGVKFDEEFGHGIEKLKHLTIFALCTPESLKPSDWKFLANTKISTLKLENMKVDNNHIAQILKAPNLEEIELNNVTLSENAFESIGTNTTLKTLRLFNSQNVHPKNFSDLRKSKLELLNIKNCPVSDSDALRFVSISTLKILDLQVTDVDTNLKSEIETRFKQFHHQQLRVSIQ